MLGFSELNEWLKADEEIIDGLLNGNGEQSFYELMEKRERIKAAFENYGRRLMEIMTERRQKR